MKTFLFLIALFYTQFVYAFLNIEALRMSKLKNNASHGSFKLGLNTQNGNVNRERYKVSSLNLYKKTKNTWILMGHYQYGETFDEEDTRQGTAHLRYTRKLSSFLFSEAYSQIQFNKFQNLNSRQLLGLGLRTTWSTKNEKIKLSFGAGTFYENEELEKQDNLNNPRGNIYSGILLINDYFNFSSTIYYQPNLENLEDYRVNFKTGIETRLGQMLFQQISYSLTKDNMPPTNIAKTDGNLLVEIGARY